MKNLVFFLFALAIYFCVSSCQAILKSAMGVKEMKPRKTEDLVRYSKKNKIPNELSYLIDTTVFCSSLNTYKTAFNNEDVLQDLVQPLQVRMFKNNELIFFHANCYTEGSLNLDWNKFNSFAIFPPTDSFNVVVSEKQFNSIFSSIRNFQEKNNQNVVTLNSSIEPTSPLFQQSTSLKNEYIIMVYWSIFLNKQSKKLIKLIKNYARKHSDKDIGLVFVNVDNIYQLKCLNENKHLQKND